MARVSTRLLFLSPSIQSCKNARLHYFLFMNRRQMNQDDSDSIFKTQSDALISQLVFEHRLPSTTVDIVLNILHHPHFNNHALTVSNTADIYKCLSDYRRKRARERSLSRPRISYPPHLAIELVVDYIALELARYGSVLPGWRYPSEEQIAQELENILKNMALVHRSWTMLAQNVLRLHLELSDDQIRAALMHPYCGHWIRQLKVICSARNNSNHARDFRALLERTSKLRALQIISWGLLSKDRDFNFLDGLRLAKASLVKLQGLYVNATSQWLIDICDIIPDLVELQNFGIRCSPNPELRQEQVNPIGLGGDREPPSSLKTISFSFFAGTDRNFSKFPLRQIAWLLTPRGDYSLRSLTLYLDRFYIVNGGAGLVKLAELSRPSLVNLKELNIGFDYNVSTWQVIQGMLNLSMELERLHIVFPLWAFRPNVTQSAFILRLPATLRSLHGYVISAADGPILQQMITHHIEAYGIFSQLESIQLRSSAPDITAWSFRALRTFCENEGLEFEFLSFGEPGI